MNIIVKIINAISKPKKCCKNCRHWTLEVWYECLSSVGCCDKSNNSVLVADNYLCGKFEYCPELLTKPDLKVIKTERELINDN